MARKPKADRPKYTWGTFGIQLIALVVSLFFIFPILMIINNAFKTKQELILNPPLSLPGSFNLDNFHTAWKKLELGTAFANSFMYTAISVLLIAMLCTITAWAIARGGTRLFKAARIYFLIGILIPAQALCLPIYLLWNSMGLINSRVGLIALYVSTGLSFGIFLQTNFMKTVPIDIEEAAVIDGCNPVQTFFRVVLPMMKPTFISVGVLEIMWVWNDYLLPYLVLDINEFRTIPIHIQYLTGSYGSVDMGATMALILMSIVPVVIFYLCCQKYIIKGVAAGAVKG